jgi:hypothetical protein
LPQAILFSTEDMTRKYLSLQIAGRGAEAYTGGDDTYRVFFTLLQK